MIVNYEIKGMLAKLLATEDIIVEHKKVDTACFNVHTRVLTLPMWNATNTVVDLLCAHEVGHARETPNLDWTKDYNIPQQFLNVTEDVRVEKLMKRRYAGLSKTFYNGYKELHEQDFFSIKDDDVSTYNLADRVNLYFKIGNFIDINFTNDEQEIVDEIANAETFEDALVAAEKLYNYCKNNLTESSNNDITQVNTCDTGSGSMAASELNDQTEGDNEVGHMENNTSNNIDSDNSENNSSDGPVKAEDNQQNSKNNSNSNSLLGGKNKEPEVSTNKSFENSLKNLINQNNSENNYVELPQIDVSKIIISNNEIHKLCKKHWEYTEDLEIDNEYLKFKKSAQSEVSYLVKEFECRKAADSYQRSSVSTTGMLDCSKLHSYKFNDDLFKKITTVSDGKNHGLIFILDWSGSMQEVILDTVKQLFNLIWFCKKASIPFEVYAFTNDYPYVKYQGRTAVFREQSYNPKEGLLAIDNSFSLMNILTSKSRNNSLDEQMRNIFRLACYFCGRGNYSSPLGMTLSGTPLDETIIALHQIIPNFQKENKLQKVQCVILTDGESCGIKYHKEVNRKWETEPYLGTRGVTTNTILRNRKTGNTYCFVPQHGIFDPTKILLKNLRDSFPDTNIIGIRILDSYFASSFIRQYCGYYGDEYMKVMDKWKKEKAFSIKTSGYNSYFGISSNSLSQSSNFNVTENATKSQIKNAFMKSLNTKKMNKKILNEFIALIA